MADAKLQLSAIAQAAADRALFREMLATSCDEVWQFMTCTNMLLVSVIKNFGVHHLLSSRDLFST
jgi:hypothetical protein